MYASFVRKSYSYNFILSVIHGKGEMLLCEYGWVFVEFILEILGQQPGLQLKAALIDHAVTKDRMFKLGVLPFFILQQEAPPRLIVQPMGRSQVDNKIILLDDPLVQAGEDDGVYHEWSKLLHQIQGKVRPSIAIGVQIADIGIKAYHVTSRMKVVVEQRVAEAEQRIDGVGWRTAHASGKAEVLFDQMSEHREIRR